MNAKATPFTPRGHSKPLGQGRSSLVVPTRTEKPLRFDDGPLVWIDCEMTGLNPKTDRILEIACLITNGNLDIVDDGLNIIIRTDKAILDNMDEWCTKQHGTSGLTAACLASPHTHEAVASTVLSYIKSWMPDKRAGVLAGSSVHADRAFLVESMPELVDHLHYRIVDVSSMKELCRRWYPQVAFQRRAGSDIESKHRHSALDDIRGSIAELKFYRENIFKAGVDGGV